MDMKNSAPSVYQMVGNFQRFFSLRFIIVFFFFFWRVFQSVGKGGPELTL